MERLVRFFFILIAFFAIISLVWHFKFGDPFGEELCFSSLSPDKHYRLDVYAEPNWLWSQYKSMNVGHVILRNNIWGWKIAESGGDCNLLLKDMYTRISIDWRMEEAKVYFSKDCFLVLK